MSKHTFLLIHGAWHGAWCWDRLVQALEQQGHTAVAMDLPGHGSSSSSSTTTPGWHINLQSYVDAVNSTARTIVEKDDNDDAAKVHVSVWSVQPYYCLEPDKIHLVMKLVGHSMGGIVVSCAAEQAPELYVSLTYVAAFLLQNGQSLTSFGRTMNAPAMMKAVSFPNLFRGYLEVRLEHTRACFYNQCSEEDVNMANSHLCPQSIRPVMTAVQTTEENWGRIPRYYVFCENDKALPIKYQRELEGELPCHKTVSLATDHSPFVSGTAQLAAALTDFAVHAEH